MNKLNSINPNTDTCGTPLCERSLCFIGNNGAQKYQILGVKTVLNSKPIFGTQKTKIADIFQLPGIWIEKKILIFFLAAHH